MIALPHGRHLAKCRRLLLLRVLVGGPLPYPSRLHDDGASMDAVHPLVDATTGLREEYGR